jgi:uncharacterized protein YqeY
MGHTESVSETEARLRAALRESMKTPDPIARAAIRSALGAIDNAGSVGGGDHEDAKGSGHIAGIVEGLGAGDVPRRELDESQIVAIVRAEITSREAAAEEYQGLGRADAAARLRSECAVLGRLLPTQAAG